MKMTGSGGVPPDGRSQLLRPALHLFLALIVTGLLVAACASDPSSPSKACPDEDYPLHCSTNNACCPKGFPVNCGGKCYATDSDARNSCSARLDTCYRE